MEMFDSAVKVLTAMITPAVLISACGALILSTSLRLGRVADRVRALFAGEIAGACLLFFGSLVLIYEARLALETINAEMNFVWHLAKFHAPEEFEAHLENARRG